MDSLSKLQIPPLTDQELAAAINKPCSECELITDYILSKSETSFPQVYYDAYYTLVCLYSTDCFQTLANNKESLVENPKDLDFFELFPGKEDYTLYHNALENSNRFMSFILRLKQKTDIPFLNNYIETHEITSMKQLINTMISEMDIALSWICFRFPIDEKINVGSILFNDKNLFRPIFSGKSSKLNSIVPFNHIYETNITNFQEIILNEITDSAFESAPQLIVFTAPPGELIVGDIPKTIALPLNLPKEPLRRVMTRVRAWESMPERGAAVIEKYLEAAPIAHYELAGSVARGGDGYKIVRANNESLSYAKREASVPNEYVCVIYAITN